MPFLKTTRKTNQKRKENDYFNHILHGKIKNISMLNEEQKEKLAEMIIKISKIANKKISHDKIPAEIKRKIIELNKEFEKNGIKTLDEKEFDLLFNYIFSNPFYPVAKETAEMLLKNQSGTKKHALEKNLNLVKMMILNPEKLKNSLYLRNKVFYLENKYFATNYTKFTIINLFKEYFKLLLEKNKPHLNNDYFANYLAVLLAKEFKILTNKEIYNLGTFRAKKYTFNKEDLDAFEDAYDFIRSNDNILEEIIDTLKART